MSAFKVSLVTVTEADVPAWVRGELEAAGIRLAIRACGTRAELVGCAGDADVVWTVGLNRVVTPEALPDLPRCKAIMRSGSGLDDIPVEAATRRGLRVVNTPEAIAGTVAEHTVALLFALVRQVTKHDRDVRHGEWKSEAAWARWHVSGQTLGLIGFGLIAREVVGLLQGFRMTLLAFDPYADRTVMQAAGVAPVALEELLRRADFISVHCPLTAETRGLLGDDAFRQMKPDALLINTSRGGVLDEPALVRALRAGRIAGAGLDVLDPEPPAPDNPLLHLENVVLTPHVAAFSDEFERRFWGVSIAKLKALKADLQG